MDSGGHLHSKPTLRRLIDPSILILRVSTRGRMDSGGHLHSKPTLRRVAVQSNNRFREREQENGEELEPVTPAGRLFNQSSLNCYILVIFGFKTQMDVEALKGGLETTLIKHKRFSSIMKEDKHGVLKWMPVDVNIDDHVTLPFIDPADNCNRNFVKKYAAKLATAPPLNPSRPLWQIHLLRVRSEEAASSLVLRVHHSLGDGVSLLSLLLACTRKASDSLSLPTIPRQAPTRSSNGRGSCKGILRVRYLIMALYNLFLVIWYTIVDIMHFLATIVWIKDSETPIKGYPGVESSPKQIEHATLSLEDFKIVKSAINGTVNDVMLGMTSAGILRYLEREYEAKAEGISESEERLIGDKQSLPSNLRVRSAILVNTRPAPGLHDLADMMKSGKSGGARWGNNLGYLILPLPMVKQQNPLDYARAATALTRKIFLSLEAPFTYASAKLLMKLAGVKNDLSHKYFILQRSWASGRGGIFRSPNRSSNSNSVWTPSVSNYTLSELHGKSGTGDNRGLGSDKGSETTVHRLRGCFRPDEAGGRCKPCDLL